MQIFPGLSQGYSTYDPVKEIPNLQGKVVLVTGANSGIGFETVKWLAAKGAKVYLGARDKERGLAAVDKVNQHISGLSSAGSVHWLQIDVETPQRVRAGAQAFLALENKLDILINNAGVNLRGFNVVSEGGLTIEKVMSINYLGAFALTQELLPVLKRTAAEPGSDVRLLMLSSNLHKQVPVKPDFRTVEGWNAITGPGFIEQGKRYMVSKLANVSFTKELQRRLDAENVPITSIVVNPGLVNSGAPERSVPPGAFATLMAWFVRNFGLSSEQGSYASLFAATSPEIKAQPEKWKGAYMEAFNRWTDASVYANDKQLAKDLWACSEEVVEACLRDG